MILIFSFAKLDNPERNKVEARSWTEIHTVAEDLDTITPERICEYAKALGNGFLPCTVTCIQIQVNDVAPLQTEELSRVYRFHYDKTTKQSTFQVRGINDWPLKRLNVKTKLNQIPPLPTKGPWTLTSDIKPPEGVPLVGIILNRYSNAPWEWGQAFFVVRIANNHLYISNGQLVTEPDAWIAIPAAPCVPEYAGS